LEIQNLMMHLLMMDCLQQQQQQQQLVDCMLHSSSQMASMCHHWDENLAEKYMAERLACPW
jgi:hypothetical protein